MVARQDYSKGFQTSHLIKQSFLQIRAKKTFECLWRDYTARHFICQAIHLDILVNSTFFDLTVKKTFLEINFNKTISAPDQ
jgi:hypothetical protein